LKTFFEGLQKGDTRNIIIDVNDLETKGVVPMELGDDEFLRKKVDDIAATFSGGGVSTTPATNNNGDGNATRTVRRSNGGNGGGNSGSSNIATYSGDISFSYPAGWVRHNRPLPQLNTLVAHIVADQTSGISVWNVTASSPDQAMYIVRNQLAAMGQYITYQKVNQANGYTMYKGVTTYAGGSTQWEGGFRSGGNGIVGITLGSSNFASYQAIFNQIISTVR